MVFAIDKRTVIQAAVLDTLACVIVLLIPALSHLVAYPLHVLEPMRIVLFGIILLMPQRKWNALLLALILPIFSFMVSGHPVFPKNIIMSGELMLNVVLLYVFLSKTERYSLSVLISMMLSKLAYYFVKYLLIAGGLLHIQLISTRIINQIVVIGAFSLAFLYYDLKKME